MASIAAISFFFPAEDGIRCGHVTGVQTCALPICAGLLYAGTEFGLFVSFDDGAHWQPLQQNLPATPVTDLVVHRNDLVVSTQGRAFWILDDLTPLHEIADPARRTRIAAAPA